MHPERKSSKRKVFISLLAPYTLKCFSALINVIILNVTIDIGFYRVIERIRL